MTKYRIIAYYHDCDVMGSDDDEPWAYDTEEQAQDALRDFIENERELYDYQFDADQSVDNQLIAYIEPYETDEDEDDNAE